MESLKGKKAIVTGGSRGLGLGITEALVAEGAVVTVIVRNAQQLAQVEKRLGVNTIQGDITDEKLASTVLQDVQPDVLILNAGATPIMAPLHELSWDDFNVAWDTDVKATLYWLQAAILLPMPKGSRVIIGSSGAAKNGSPLSGSYSGAKRMQWLMAGYANELAKGMGLDIHFQTIVPMQIIGDTELGQKAASAYARRKGVSTEAFLAGFGTPLPPRMVGEHVVTILTDPGYETGIAYGLKGDAGIIPLDN